MRSHVMIALLLLFAFGSLSAESHELGRVFAEGERTTHDRRLATPRSVAEGNHFQPFTDRAAWETRVRQLREKSLVAAGLWPLPERCPLNPTITSIVDRGDYTIENIYFASHPGFYVTGSLFRPKGNGPFPVVLNAHGHAKRERLEEANPTARDAKPIVDPFPYQARGIGFARLGCIAFLYDMVGYAEATQVRHPTDSPKVRVPDGTDDFEGLDFEMHGLSTLGLQTWNSMRAVDYLLSRPDVDPKRIAITGASGGATQTLMLMMTDDRIAAAAPVCMVSPGFQGDCTCEQCALLKIKTDTVEYCAAFSPKPLMVVGATGDWTKEIIEKGGPEILASYALMGARDQFSIVRFQAPHNYNRRSREAVYDWLNRSWNLGHASPIHESSFEPTPSARLRVFNDAHPRPADAVDAQKLKQFLIDSGQKQMQQLRPTSADKLVEFRQVMGTALQHMVATELPRPQEVHAESLGIINCKNFVAQRLLLSRDNSGEQVPAILFLPANPNGAATLVVHPEGKAALLDKTGEPGILLSGLLDKGQTVLCVDVFATGESLDKSTLIPDAHLGFFPCFNRTLLAQRIHDILTCIAYLHGREGTKGVNLVGLKEAGPWCLLARGLCGEQVARTGADVGPFRFSQVKDVANPMYLPGALRYGDLPALAALSAPAELLISDAANFDATWTLAAYRNAASGDHSNKCRIEREPVSDAELLEWLAR